jgi:hypothetical protein
MLYLTFENVPTEKVDLVKNRLFEILGAIASGSEKLDMKRMHTIIQKHILESLSHLENSPHETVAFMIIGDMLYGNTTEDVIAIFFDPRNTNQKCTIPLMCSKCILFAWHP